MTSCGAGICGQSRCAPYLVLLVFAFLVEAEAVNLVLLPCGATVPIDSLTPLDPIWSLSTYRDKLQELSGSSFRVQKASISGNQANILSAESGVNPSVLTLFQIGNSFPQPPNCSCLLDPLAGAPSSTTIKSTRLAFLGLTNVLYSEGGCADPVTVTVLAGDRDTTIAVPVDREEGYVASVSFSVSKGGWPITVSFPSNCSLQLLVLTDRAGELSWFAWIPATVYTSIILALTLPAIILRQKLPVIVTVVLVAIVYIGYLGCCIGLVSELVLWQTSIGRMFPFPPPVTLYCCLVVLYILLMGFLVCSQKHYYVMMTAVSRLLIYGLNCALCIGYWIAGYILLGSLALLQYVVTNGVLTWYFSYLTVRLRHALPHPGGIVSGSGFSNTFAMLWFVPFTPFAPCTLMYYDLLFIEGHADSQKQLRWCDAIRFYSVLLSLPMVVIQNIWGVALVATATAFHMSFVVVLFAAVLLWSLHCIYSLEQYVRERKRWRERGVHGAPCWLSLEPILTYLLDPSNYQGSTPGRRNGDASQRTPYSLSMQRQQDHHHVDEAVPPQQCVWQYPKEMVTLSPTMAVNNMVNATTPFTSQQKVGTPPQRVTNIEFWPNSVER